MCRSSRYRRWAVIGILAVVPALPACRTGLTLASSGPRTDSGVEPGAYADDERFADLAATWDERVTRALERLKTVTSLGFGEGALPRVILRAFGDETRPHELRAEIVDGRRRSILHINVEPILGGVRDADRLLAHALAAAAFQDAAGRHGPVPRWAIRMAGLAAAGDVERHLEVLHRRMLEGDAAALRVDAKDPTAAEATGVAGLLLLAERGRPEQVRRLLRFVADGDPADTVFGRLVREPDGSWVRPARIVYRSALADLDAEPWHLLGRASAAAQETGRAGLLAVLPAKVPPEIADEIHVLRAQAAADEGDYEEARTMLAALSPRAPMRLRDPAAALALRIRGESRAGGDAVLARRLALRLDRDFPRSAARAALRESHPLLGMEEDPQRWLANTRKRVEREGTDHLDPGTLQRYVRTLLLDHRAGEAARFLELLGDRGQAPELAAVRRAILSEQAQPSGAALARGNDRVVVWLADPGEDTARDVRETGAAAYDPLRAAFKNSSVERRQATAELLVGTMGEVSAVAAARVEWKQDPARIRADLDALAAAVSYPVLQRALETQDLGVTQLTQIAKAWEALTLGLSRRWLNAHPAFLRALRHETFAIRREAFTKIGSEAPQEVTPAFVAYGLKDRAALLRREAIRLAGEAEFRALARRGLTDRAWLVREEAARVVSRLEGADAVSALLRLVREDESLEVRAAAALALLRVASDNDRVIDTLLATQVEEEPRLRDAIGGRMAELSPLPVARGIARGWRRALKRTRPNRGYLFRTAVLFQRLTNTELRYYPGATAEELRAMLGRMETWIDGAERRPKGAGDRNARTPTGRDR